ncbi:MAG: dynamin family protein, partial [Staphylococcus carnosus]
IHPHFNIDMNKDEIDTLHIDFEQMYQSLPKKLSKKRLLQPKAQKEIQEDVTMNTVELLQDDINLLRQQLEQQVKLMGQTAEKQINAISDEIHQQADELLKVKLDTSLIKQIDSAHAELKSIL